MVAKSWIRLLGDRTTTKRIKDLGINLPKEVKDMYTGNYRTLMKETENINNASSIIYVDILCSCMEGLTLLKMSIPSKAI